MRKIPKGRGKKGLFREFSGPQLTQASVWLAWAPKLLRGEGISSPGRAAMVPKAIFWYK